MPVDTGGQRTDSLPLPGYNTNQGPVGIVNHQQWLDAVVDYLSSKWAHGDRTLPGGWNNATFGSPDPANNNGAPTPATQIAFARYAAAYRPGLDGGLDNLIPWTAPGPNDYIEDPAVTAARVAQSNWERTFGQTQSNQDRAAWQQAWANDLQRYGYQVQAGANANNFAASLFEAASGNWQAAQNFARGIYDTQANLANSANNFNSNVYNTQGSMYNANEGNKRGALESAGTLAQALQGMWDARTNNAISLQAHPNDFIQRESAVRALAGPQGTDVPGYNNVDALSEVINRLINYTPGAQPNAPTAAANPTAPGLTPAPTPPVYGAGAGAMPSVPQPTTLQSWLQSNPMSQVTAATRPTDGGGGTLPTVPNYGPGGNVVTPHVQHYTEPAATPPANQHFTDEWGNYSDDGGATWHNPGGQVTTNYAYGGTTGQTQFITGDPQHDGGPNPELVQVLNPGPHTRTRVTPLKTALAGMPMYGYGTADLGASEWTGDPQNPANNMEAYYRDVPGVGQSMGYRPKKTPVVGGYDPPALDSGYANRNGLDTVSQPYAQALSNYVGQTTQPNYSNQAPQVTLKSYADSAYQNLPSLRYLQGNMGRTGYNTLATGNAAGAFGTQAPESGSINYGKWLDIANDPVSAALLESIYASANRDLASEVSRAKARAPFGQAVQTSLIRT